MGEVCVLMSPAHIGRIIGRAGANIAQIRNVSAASIHIDRFLQISGSEIRVIRCSGTSAQLRQALCAIVAVMDDQDDDAEKLPIFAASLDPATTPPPPPVPAV
eukprot:NODE_25485_length_585_cov_5.076419.p1 GENE.NODE_25485_length_585_cov_5.076419~~NODE_25485_length_585_cov_5.076419.p1  ORF type:complete len:103 (-),score=33.02 NODE_25485_length_585_cov_5.076419:275-583(-)